MPEKGQEAGLGEPEAFPNADRNKGKYWVTRPTYMYTAHCANCGEDLLRAMEAEYAGYGDAEGLQCEVDELHECPACEWPMSENAEQCLREDAEERGHGDPYGKQLPVIHKWVVWHRNEKRAQIKAARNV